VTIDGGLLYIVKTRLQGAVDGAALAAAKALSRGNDSATQISNAKLDAATFVKLNFPSSYFFSSDATINQATDVTVDLSQQYQRVVTVNAHVTEPTLFMRWLNFNSTAVNASVTTTRRDINVMIVMDRSGSLASSGSCAPLKSAAQNFSDMFSEGRDNVGLITFASSSRVDFPLANNFKTGTPGIDTIIGNVTCVGGTNSAQGLWTGYQQLAALAQTGALNVILFFTDGDPTAVTANFVIKPTSTCTDKTNKVGMIAVAGTAPSAAVWGLNNYQAPAQPFAGDNSSYPPNSTSCSYTSSYTNVGNDVTGIPSTDFWGNSLVTGYKPVTTAGGLLAATSNNTNGVNLNNAAINAADNAGLRIRTGATPGNGSAALPGVIIYSIGLGMSGAQSVDFLQRVANDPASSSFSPSQAAGLYIPAPTSSDLASAFNRVASEILRIAK